MADNIGYIFLKEIELTALLRAAGNEAWYGPHSGETDRIEGREDLNRILAGLYSKGIAAWDSGHAVINGEIDKAVSIISNADRCILAITYNDGANLRYIYPGEGCVACLSVSEHEEDTFRLAVMSFDEWIKELETSGFFPEQIGSAPEIPEPATDEATAVMEMHDMKTGSILEQIHIVDNGGYGVICLTSANDQKIYLCGRDEYTGLLHLWMGVKI